MRHGSACGRSDEHGVHGDWGSRLARLASARAPSADSPRWRHRWTGRRQPEVLEDGLDRAAFDEEREHHPATATAVALEHLSRKTRRSSSVQGSREGGALGPLPSTRGTRKRQLLSPRYIKHSARVLFVVAQANPKERAQILDALFDLSRPEIVRVQAGTLKESALSAHDYVHDIFEGAERKEKPSSRVFERSYSRQVRSTAASWSATLASLAHSYGGEKGTDDWAWRRAWPRLALPPVAPICGGTGSIRLCSVPGSCITWRPRLHLNL